MVITEVPELGRLRYVHVYIDTISGFIMATDQTGESTKHVSYHCLKCFVMVGHPNMIKRDNGSGHLSQTF